MSTHQSLSIGIDLGATKIASVLVDCSGTIHDEERIPTRPERGVNAVLDDLARQVERLLAASVDVPVAGVGIGSPGRVDGKRGIVYNAVNLGWKEVAILEGLRLRLQRNLPIWLVKDANAAAFGEYCFGAAQGVDHFVMLTIGSGLGVGVIAGGHLLTGAHGNAAELGHLVLEPDGIPCVCGQVGCAETLISGPGLERLAARFLETSSAESCFHHGDAPTARQIVAAAHEADPLSVAVLQEMGRHLGEVMAACAAVLDPALMVIGGGLGLPAFPWLLPAVQSELNRRLLPATARRVKVSPAQTKSSAVGAASLVCYQSVFQCSGG